MKKILLIALLFFLFPLSHAQRWRGMLDAIDAGMDAETLKKQDWDLNQTIRNSNHNPLHWLIDTDLGVYSVVVRNSGSRYNQGPWDRLKTIRVFVDAGVDRNALTNGGQTPLHMILSISPNHKNLKEKEDLEELKATILYLITPENVNIQNDQGYTPFFEAILNRWKDKKILSLLATSENVDMKANDGNDPLQIATRSGNQVAIDIIKGIKSSSDQKEAEKTKPKLFFPHSENQVAQDFNKMQEKYKEAEETKSKLFFPHSENQVAQDFNKMQEKYQELHTPKVKATCQRSGLTYQVFVPGKKGYKCEVYINDNEKPDWKAIHDESFCMKRVKNLFEEQNCGNTPF